MNTLGKVLETFSAKKGEKGLPRPEVPLLNVIYKFGIQYDKFAGKDEEKAVMIVGKNAYELALSQGIDLKYGSLGENILLDFNPHDYCVGTVLKMGTCVLEITQHCTICNHLNVFDESLPMLLKECRGLYCKVLKSGSIYKNMRVNHVKDTLLNEKIA
jgi:MOSC domain-containing protein YiiM